MSRPEFSEPAREAAWRELWRLLLRPRENENGSELARASEPPAPDDDRPAAAETTADAVPSGEDGS